MNLTLGPAPTLFALPDILNPYEPRGTWQIEREKLITSVSERLVYNAEILRLLLIVML